MRAISRSSQVSWRGRAGWAFTAGARQPFDWLLLSAVALLSVMGTALVWSATSGSDPIREVEFLRRHLLHVAVGAAVLFAVAGVDYRISRAYAPIIYLVTTLGLAVVFTPLGEVVNGSRGWVVLAGLQAQPSEFAKVGTLLGAALLLGEPRDGEYAPTNRDVLFSLVALAVPITLILLQPDLGTALVLTLMYVSVLALSGASLRWIAALGTLGVVSVVAVWWLGLLQPYQLDRVTTLVDPNADPQGVGYNANQALIAVGSGGITGSGLFQGEQTSGNFVPEQHTDFVFTVAAEELGLIGGAVVIVGIATVIWRVLRVGNRCEQPYARLVCIGIAAWLAFQSLINIGMALGIMPITGVPLPFLSYGGTATIAHLTAIGLVLGIRRREPYG